MISINGVPQPAGAAMRGTDDVWPQLTVALFQTFAGAGTMNLPERINDTNTAIYADADAIDEYSQVIFPKASLITQWRYYGHDSNNNDGVWKIQFQALGGDWIDWVTGIATRGASWTTFSSETEVLAIGIRLVCTTVDTGVTKSRCAELEVKY